jgi:hypothetical protein
MAKILRRRGRRPKRAEATNACVALDNDPGPRLSLARPVVRWGDQDRGIRSTEWVWPAKAQLDRTRPLIFFEGRGNAGSTPNPARGATDTLWI